MASLYHDYITAKNLLLRGIATTSNGDPVSLPCILSHSSFDFIGFFLSFLFFFSERKVEKRGEGWTDRTRGSFLFVNSFVFRFSFLFFIFLFFLID